MDGMDVADDADTRLLVSLAGLRAGSRTEELLHALDERGVGLTLLLRPRTCVRSPLAAWAADRVRRGDRILLHGYDHAVLPRPSGWRRRRAEFAGLGAHEARLRLAAACAVLERSELPVDGFAPPRWLASPGTLAALRGHGFALCADATGVHDLRTGDLHRARVLNAPGGHASAVRCFGFVQAAARAARRGGLIRIGGDTADLAGANSRHAFLDAVDIALDAGARPATYGDLVAVPARS